MTERNETGNTPAPPLTKEEVEARLAAADGVLGAGGHQVTDPVAREIVRRSIRGEITSEEADRLILAHCGVTPRAQKQAQKQSLRERLFKSRKLG